MQASKEYNKNKNMKKNIAKQLRELSEGVPYSLELVSKGRTLKGAELDLQEVIKLNERGEVVNDDAIYKKKELAFREIDHYNRLKEAYKQQGHKGITLYFAWLDDNNRRVQKILDLSKQSIELKNIIKSKKVLTLWQRILIKFKKWLTEIR